MTPWRNTRQEVPAEGGTVGCELQDGTICWMYWNPDRQTWHPTNGWRRKVGYPREYVAWWIPLPRRRR